MEVKDINTLTNMLVGKRSQKNDMNMGAMNAVQDFKSMITGDKLFNFSSMEKTSGGSQISMSTTSQMDEDFSSQKINNKQENPIEEDSVSNTEKVKDKKTQKPEKNNKEEQVTSSQTEDSSNTSVSETEQSDVQNQTKTEETNESSGEKQEEIVASAPEIADATNPETVSEDVADIEESDKIEFDISDLLGVMDLQGIGAVTVYNVSENTYSVMSGEELSDFISSADSNLLAFTSKDSKSDITLVDLSKPLDKQGVELQGFEKVLPEKDMMLAGMQSAEKQTTPAAEEMLIQQADKLAEAVGSDKKLNIKVDVKEENFAYTTAKVSVKETLVNADVKENGNLSAIVSQSAGEKEVKPQVTTGNNPVNMQAVAAVEVQSAAQASKNIQQINVAVVKTTAETNTTNLSNMAGTNVAAQSAKAETAVQGDNKTTFKDVFKGMSREVVDQVKVNITKSAVKGVDNIEIKLKPEELGHIEIKMQIAKDGKLQAHIVTSRAETLDILQKEIPSLEKAFSDAGFSLDSGSLSFSHRQEDQASKEQASELRNFIGNVLEQENDNENYKLTTQLPESWDGTSALNIRV